MACCRYSKGFMPIANLFRNCSYYWVFAAFVSYFINHPLYTPPPIARSAVALSLAMVCQLCNLRQAPLCWCVHHRLCVGHTSHLTLPAHHMLVHCTIHLGVSGRSHVCLPPLPSISSSIELFELKPCVNCILLECKVMLCV